MAKVIKLASSREAVAADVRKDVSRLLDHVSSVDCVAYATVILYADGTCGVQTRACGNRTLLLGAVADLQYTLARDGG